MSLFFLSLFPFFSFFPLFFGSFFYLYKPRLACTCHDSDPVDFGLGRRSNWYVKITPPADRRAKAKQDQAQARDGQAKTKSKSGPKKNGKEVPTRMKAFSNR
ncbi:hypothetical protein QBC42DRAFT_266642 [Cladorrhinum samala]|uniref:Secreted protein n=1 Tax=Cladorrhinum samala TaxID=585594 RepID=A0AAV9HTF7_9PEZI|nr:hypothetical protein QBC42DRAFT_266642 [Cladorrhinum samala]